MSPRNFHRRLLLFGVVGLLCLATGSGFAQANTAAIEALSRLKGIDLEANPALKTAVLKVVESARGTPQFVELVRDFKLKGQSKELLAFADKNPSDSLGVEALRLAVQEVGLDAIKPLTPGVIHAMSNAAEKEFVPTLQSVVTDEKQAVDARKSAVKGLAQLEDGATFLLKLAAEDKLDPALKFTASAALNSARWPEIKAEAAKLLPLPQGQAAALPPVSELVKLKGDSANGAKVFRRPEVNCIACHQINGEGADFGPALSEIGNKLAREALYESILDPSSGISFGFEAWQLELKNGDEPFGLLASETADEITIKTQNGISTKYKKSDVVTRKQGKLSTMPAGLQMAMSQQDLVDLIEYLASLKKPAK